MGITGQLSQLQEADIELESVEKAVRDITHRLEGSEALAVVKSRLDVERRHLAELKKQQQSAEHEANDIDIRLKKVEGELNRGRIRSQKELSGLQHEADILKAGRNKLESRELEIMEQAEQIGRRMILAEKELQTVEAGWQRQKEELLSGLERAREVLARVAQRRQNLAGGIEPFALSIYQDVKRAKGKAVVPVERGICTACRIALSVADAQGVRRGELVRCGSCGRILYAP